jgi:hypothetical protein
MPLAVIESVARGGCYHYVPEASAKNAKPLFCGRTCASEKIDRLGFAFALYG